MPPGDPVQWMRIGMRQVAILLQFQTAQQVLPAASESPPTCNQVLRDEAGPALTWRGGLWYCGFLVAG